MAAAWFAGNKSSKAQNRKAANGGKMNFGDGQKFWFALQVRAKHEFSAASILHAKGYEEFVPTYRSRRRWSDRWKEQVMPLFPGYVFCRFNGDGCGPIVTTPGVIRIVTIGSKQLAQVSDEEIDMIRNTLKHELSVLPWTQSAIGSTVRIKTGALAGVCGSLVNYKNKNYLVITIDAIQRSIAVPRDECELVAPANAGMPAGAISSQDHSPQSAYSN